MFSRWLNIAQQKVFQVAHSCILLKIRVLPTEGETVFYLNVRALNAGAFYEPTWKQSWKFSRRLNCIHMSIIAGCYLLRQQQQPTISRVHSKPTPRCFATPLHGDICREAANSLLIKTTEPPEKWLENTCWVLNPHHQILQWRLQRRGYLLMISATEPPDKWSENTCVV